MKRSLYSIPIMLLWGYSFALFGQGGVSFTGTEFLGRPTDHSITVNVVATTALQAYFEYGTSSGSYTAQTATFSAAANEPIEAVMEGLSANTHYYYRMVYSQNGGSTWVERDEHSFWTQRAQGSTFRFTITSDSHINVGGLGNVSQWRQALNRIAADNPDLHLDLGDTFQMDGVTTAAAADNNYLFQRASDMMGIISHSTPIFLAMGNHENEEGWNFDDTNPQPIFSMNARKRYYPNPIPDGFYSGNTDVSETRISGDHLREDYYAWEWGDALFIVFDPFQYTMTNPYGASAGEGNDDPASGDRWNWTLGQQQYDWLEQTLENSSAKYKFMFAHHLLGGTQNYVRGGAVPAPWFEWGGNTVNSNNQNETWEFNTKRPGMAEPIRQLMIDNGVSAFFHGHDHQFVYEKRDGIVYQEVPSPSMGSGYGFNLYTNSPYVQPGGNLPNSGYLRLTVSPTNALVEYVNTDNGNVTYSYTIDPNGGGTGNIPPTAVASANPTSGDAPLAVNFTGNNSSDSDGSIVSYAWTFGDGGTANTANPSHTYTSAGNYTATLTVTDDDGATDSDQVTITVNSVGGENQPPVPVISSPASGQNFASGATVSFSGSATDPEDGNLNASTAVWTVNGPGVPTNYVLATGTFSGSRTAPANGTFSLTLQVEDSQGLSASTSTTFTVGGTANTPPTAVASANPTSGTAPLAVNFTGSNSTDSDGSITSYAWTFGDGGTANTANPSHTYTSAGNYPATLTVTDDDGATDSDQVTINVSAPGNNPPTAVASANPTSGTAPLAVNFTGSNSTDSDGSIASYAWTFGDGGTANTANPAHTYNNPGNYTATLTVTDNNGATDADQVNITVNPPANSSPVATITLPTNGANFSVGQVASYAGTGTDAEDGTIPASRFRWLYRRNGGAEVQFASGQSSGSIVAAASGTYNVILEVTDSNGATDRDDVTITIGGTAKRVAAGQELVDVSATPGSVPDEFGLLSIHPNPFNPDTHISFSLRYTDNVYLEVYDTVGHLIRTLIAGEKLDGGSYRYYWNGLDNMGQPTSSGVYIFRLRSSTAISSRKAILLK